MPLIGSFTNRSSSGSKDQRFINIFPETRKVDSIESTRIFLNKRPGLTKYKTIVPGNGRGLAWFRSKFYYIIDNKVYEDSGSPTAIVTLTGRFGFTVMVIPVDVAGLPVAQVAFEVKTQVTISPFTKAAFE